MKEIGELVAARLVTSFRLSMEALQMPLLLLQELLTLLMNRN